MQKDSYMAYRQIWCILMLGLHLDFVQTYLYHRLLYINEEKQTECFLYNYRYFCQVRLEDQLDTMNCFNGARWSFFELRQNYVTPDDLINWSIPFHLIEKYADYLNVSSSSMGMMTLCNCSENRIGTKCEYQLFKSNFDISFVIKNQRSTGRLGRTELPLSLIDGIVCNAGSLDIEWRQICDGIVHCQDAIDEFNCHLLELNQCEADEYQCRNGMCIPREFLFDTLPDCMDASDEQELEEISALDQKCLIDSLIDCDERLCDKDEFSCGDGTCVKWSALIDHSNRCENSRDAAYLCETVDQIMTDRMAWTGICDETTRLLANLIETSDCITSLRYLLIDHQRKDLNEIRARSFNNIIDRCPERIQYPEGTVLSPVLRMYYNKSWIREFYNGGQNFSRPMPRKPHLFCLNGTMVCDGIWMTLAEELCFNQEDFQRLSSYPFFPVPYLFCEEAQRTFSTRFLWKQLHTTSYYSCRNTSDRLSLRRINDGFIDCLYGDDERNNIDLPIKSYRYRCETSQSFGQYVSYQHLGNKIRECTDGSDEISREVRWSAFKCDVSENYACWVLQDDGISENRIANVRLPFHRHCDSIWDTMDGKDERNCTQWMCVDETYRCNRTGQCILPNYICDGEFDCDDGEDELNCSRRLRQWTLESECNNTSEHFCITPEYLQNRSSTRPCISYVQAGDGIIDCIGARDERNVISCSDHLMLGDRFLCDNRTKCLEHTSICNGIADCLDGMDELICFWNRTQCSPGQFSCPDERYCKKSRCNPRDICSDKSNWFWCPNSTNEEPFYRSTKHQRLANYEISCYKRRSIQPASSTVISAIRRSTNAAPVPIVYGYCNLGFYLNIGNGTNRVCFCPPSFYGDRCQFNSRRILVRVRFEQRDRQGIPSNINVLVLLVYNHSHIVDHKYFTNANTETPSKYNIYLLYPRPRALGIYSVRFEAYNSNRFFTAWEFVISPFDFLPVYRLSKILRIPDRALPWLCSANQCENNGTCYIINNGQPLCLCSRGWQGILCETKLLDIQCAEHSLARDRHICICPQGYLEPHCFVRNTRCERTHACPAAKPCFGDTQHPPNRYWCLCETLSCEEENTIITMHRRESNQLPFLLQLLKISSDYPRVKQQILVRASTIFPSITRIKTFDVRNAPRTLPEIGLLYKFEPQTRSISIILHLLFINCSESLRNYTVDLDIQPQRCQSLSSVDFHSVKNLQDFCRRTDRNSCFHLEGYICYCNSQTNERSECISYHQRQTDCRHCLNQGYCVQGDLRNRSDFVCVCPKCASGKLCQFSSSRFSISLEFLINKANWNLVHYIGPVIFLLFGMILNSFSILTFMPKKIRQKAIGLLFLVASITNELVLVFLTGRVVYLYTSRLIQINDNVNTVLCKSLPYLMPSLYYLSLWLLALVTVERMLIVTFPRKFLALRSLKSTILLIIIICAIIFGSNYIHIDQYNLISHSDDRFPWCISEIKANNEQYLTQYITLTYQMCPFLLNLIAGLVIIITISRSKATSHHLQVTKTLAKQVRQRVDLLLGPIICFITQLPQIIILFLDVCDYNSTSWFVQLTLAAYYISFTPQISLFFLYVLPSTSYRKTFFDETKLGKGLVRMISTLVHLFIFHRRR